MPSFMHELGAAPLEAGDTRVSRWLRARWLTLGGAIALVEGTLVVAGSIPKWIAFIVACALLFVYFSMNRERLDPVSRIGLRIVAFSQLIMLAVPLLLAIVTAAAIMALVLIAVLVLAMLFRKRF
ncbi:MAG: hypothetical protein QOE29_344 [Gaiellaceae bacterium]|jgi:uncharacterized membrane protein YphA (DoxX/SURF4 family)|nr:hypothetical protein [Gaiellaceae bacterium]